MRSARWTAFLGLFLLAWPALAPGAEEGALGRRLELVQTIPPGTPLAEAELLRLLGADGYGPAQQQAVLDQVLVFAAPEALVVLPAQVQAGQEEQGLPLQVYNRTERFLSILWEQSYYLDNRGNSKLAPKGLRISHPTGERPGEGNSVIHPNRIPPGLFFKGHVFPVRDFDFTTGQIRHLLLNGQIGLYLVLEPAGGKPFGVSLLLKSQPIPPTPAPPDQAAPASPPRTKPGT